jgi:hypothetical protein
VVICAYIDYLVKCLYRIIDPIIDIRNTTVNVLKNTILPIAGPGQSQASHHPMPNSADPIIRFLSIIHVFFHEK